MTSWPSLIAARDVAEPMNPAPPVTIKRMRDIPNFYPLK
jgi:hypothetical protein